MITIVWRILQVRAQTLVNNYRLEEYCIFKETHDLRVVINKM